MKFKFANFQRQKQGGFLSIEAIGVVLLIVAGLAIAASRMGMLSGGSEASEEVSNIQTLYSNVKALKGNGGYGAAGTDLVAQLSATGGIPKNMSLVSGKIYNAFGGQVSILSTGVGFSVTTANVPTSVCNKAVTSISRGGAFASTTIGSNAAIVGEVTAATAASQCTDGVTVVFTAAA